MTRSTLICAAGQRAGRGGRTDLRGQVGDVAGDPDAGHVGPAGRVGRDVLAGPGRMLDRAAARAPPAGRPAPPSAARPPATSRATSRAVGQPHAGQPVVGDLAARPTSPSTTAMPRAASCSACSAVGAGAGVREQRDVGAPAAGTAAPGAPTIGPVASTPIARSRTSQPWQYGQCSDVAAPPLAQPGHVGQLVDQPGGRPAAGGRAPSGRRPAARANRSPSRATVGDLAGRRPRRRTPRPRPGRAPAARAGGMPSRPSSPCTPSAGALRGAPASTTSTDRRARASISAPLSPAAPPPTTTTSYVAVAHRRPPPRTTVRPTPTLVANFVADLANWRHGRRPGPGARGDRSPAAGAAPAARDHAGRAVRGDRHLGEHAVPAGVRRPQARPWSCCCRWPGRTGSRSTSWSTPRRPATRASTSRPVTRHGMTMLPLTRRAGGIQAYKLVIPAGGRRAAAGPADARGLRVAVRPQRPAAGRARRARPGAVRPARRPSSTPGCRTGSAPPTTSAVEFLSLFGRQGERAHLRARPRSPARS